MNRTFAAVDNKFTHTVGSSSNSMFLMDSSFDSKNSSAVAVGAAASPPKQTMTYTANSLNIN